jgi:cytochrome c oxidase assembly protein Cox11
MVILKKIPAATLVETLVASVIIVIVFMIASLSLNNIFKGTITSNGTPLQNRIKELSYLSLNKKITIPFYENTSIWEITIEKQNGELILYSVNKIVSKNQQIPIGYED